MTSREEQIAVLAERYVAAFLAFERAPAELYAAEVISWRSITNAEIVLHQAPSGARLRELLPDIEHRDVAWEPIDVGFRLTYTTTATVLDGSVVAIPVRLDVHVNGDLQICRFDEHADAATAAPLLAALGG